MSPADREPCVVTSRPMFTSVTLPVTMSRSRRDSDECFNTRVNINKRVSSLAAVITNTGMELPGGRETSPRKIETHGLSFFCQMNIYKWTFL